MKKLFFAAFIVIAIMVVIRLVEQNKPDNTEQTTVADSEEKIFDVKNEDISDEDISLESQADDVEEETPELTQDEDETIVE